MEDLVMRNRRIQRELKKCDKGMIGIKDSFGYQDPTAYLALKNMTVEKKRGIRRQLDRKDKEKV